MDQVNTTDRGRLLTFDIVALFFTIFFMFFALDFFIPVLPFYIVDLGGSETLVGILMGVFTFCSVIFRPMQGRVVDRRGRKKILLTGIIMFILSGVGIALVPRLEALIVFRALQGVGWGGFLLTFNILIIDLAPPLRRGEAVGILGTATPLALATAPSFAEFMREAVGNYTIVFLVSALAALVALLISLFINEPENNKNGLEGPGLNKKLFSRGVLVPSVMMFFITFSLGGILTFLPLLGEQRGIGEVGYFFTIFAAAVVAARPLSGRISDRFGRMVAFVPGILLLIFSLVLIALAQGMFWLAAGGICFGFGLGFTHTTLMALAADRISENERGVGMATFTTAFDLGIASGASVLGLLLLWFNFFHLFIVCALLAAVPLVTYTAAAKRGYFT